MAPYALYRIIPFVTFMAFIGCEELLRFLGKNGLIATSNSFFLFLYPFRTITVGLLLLLFWKRYDEVHLRDLLNFRNTLLSVGAGIAVFYLWINMPWTLGAKGAPSGYNPTVVSENLTRHFLITVRLLGAAVVVPVMEELFWRSFLLRYIIATNVEKVSIGTFTWGSFLICNLLFGLEHHYIAAGIMAGISYSLLVYRTDSIMQCILAHGITNLLLGVYVLRTEQWQFW